jgi:hypothetical protein
MLALTYNREMDQLVVANIVNSEVEEENIMGSDDEKESEGPKTTHLRDMIIESNKGREEPTTPTSTMDEEAKELMTPRSIMGSNNVNNTLREISSIHCI